MSKKRKPRISDSRVYAGNVVTPLNRREFMEMQARGYREQYLRANDGKDDVLDDNELQRVSMDYAKHVANKEVKHFKAFLKGHPTYKYKGDTFPVITREFIKSAKTAEQIVEIKNADEGSK